MKLWHILTAATGLYLIRQFSGLQHLNTKFAGLAIKNLGLSGFDCIVTLSVFNPSRASITIRQMVANLVIDTVQVGQLAIMESTKQKINILPGTTSQVALPFRVSNLSVVRYIVELLRNPTKTQNIECSGFIDTGIIKAPFTIKQTLNLASYIK
jgi:LEA14-like dessication related protein